jgi:hypothetical protein
MPLHSGSLLEPAGGLKNLKKGLGMVVYSCNPSTQKAEAGKLWVPGQLVLYIETLSLKKKKLEILLKI